jgi:hypothetical protein
LTLTARPVAQPEHHRAFAPDRPKLAAFSPQVSHFLLMTFTAPACDFAQPEHQRFFRSCLRAPPKL